ncbi:MAG: alpha/beta fold hydrolase [Lentisphaerae bacterium]|jgi:uncharacterized protein|nr:alpha/beta fold hydrolase [Lentisphaerota bacterium]MBT4820907.1 alpha/beta fold hydrolase [Lentisphaerota bacterium]MBT5607007.1 alpha/beta fold hydrolase [Lentisphaerota bacterium]MBT7059708.1 alpha/beta fold hydrolase [Lentisphaerota bacterium]MBT7843285.1 alpha/beta fold hydrolase [Lentisphaerota bacterium]
MSQALIPVIEVAPGLTEQTVSIPSADTALCGNMLTPGSASGVTVVFSHGWSGNRSGPHDLVTQLARTLGTHGHASLRFDFRGRGESGGQGLETTLTTMADDLTAAVAFASENASAKRLVVLGICSGGNVAVGSLPRLKGVEGLILLSVYPFSDGDAFSRDVHRTWHFARQYWQKAMRPETWKRLFRGDVRVFQVLNVLFGHYMRKRKKEDMEDATRKTGAQSAPTQGESRKSGKEPPKKHLVSLKEGVRGVMIYGSADPDAAAGRRYFETYVEAHDLPIAFTELAGANHNFSSVPWKAEIAEQAVSFCNSLADNSQ